MQAFSSVSNTMLSQIDPDLAKAARAARIQGAFAEALMAACETPEVGLFMLSHIQGVYILRDDAPCKGGKAPILLRVYSDDSVVRAELDARQEWIRLQLGRRNITYDKMVIHASKYGMRERRPFDRFIEGHDGKAAPAAADVERHNLTACEIEDLAARVGDSETSASLRAALEATSEHAASAAPAASPTSPKAAAAMVEQLETLKRAFCLAFGEDADTVLAKVNAAYIAPLAPVQADDDHRLRFQRNRCMLYVSDPRFKDVMDAYDDQVRKHAYHLGLRIYGRIAVRRAPSSIADKRAFPSQSAPVIVALEGNA